MEFSSQLRFYFLYILASTGVWQEGAMCGIPDEGPVILFFHLLNSINGTIIISIDLATIISLYSFAMASGPK